MFFSGPSLRDIRYRLDNLVDDFDHSDLRRVIKDIERIMRPHAAIPRLKKC